MSNPLTAPVLGFASRLRFPTLFKITVGLMLVSWLWPFDPLPFIDEIATALAVLVLSRWRVPEPPPAPPAPREGITIEGEARRE